MSLPAVTALPPRSGPGWASFGAGLVIAVVGAWLAFRALHDLGPNLTALPAPRRDALLVDSGIYARVRHPIYAGVITVAVGWALIAVSAWALGVAMLLAAWLDLKSRREEVWLLAHHAGYAAYRARTRRFVPGIY